MGNGSAEVYHPRDHTRVFPAYQKSGGKFIARLKRMPLFFKERYAIIYIRR